MKVSEDFMLRVLNGEFRGRVLPLRDSIDIGSGSDCELRLRDAAVSPSHARLHRDGDDVVVEDLGSSLGTFLNEKPVDRANLRTGDLLRIGRTRLSVISSARVAGAGEAGGVLAKEGEASDSRLIERAKTAEARKVQLEKARARLTRENEELVKKLACEKAARRKPAEPGGLPAQTEATGLEQERLAEELKSALEIRTRLAVLLKAARGKISRLEKEQAEPEQVIESRTRALQEELDVVREELDGARGSAGDIEQARDELRSLGEKYRESEAEREDLGGKLSAKEAELAESALGRQQLLLRLEAAEEEKKRLELSEDEFEKHREESAALRAEVLDLRKELDSSLAERKRETETYRGERDSLAAENRRCLEDSRTELRESFARRIEELEALNAKSAAELKARERELEERAAEFERGLASRTELEARCGEAQKERELLDSESARQRETIASQADALALLEGRLQEVSRELSSLERERENKEGHLGREFEVLQGRLAAAEKNRRDQESRLDGLEDQESSRSCELLLLRRYVDDVRRRLLEKEALLDDLRARLRLEVEPAEAE